MERKILIVDIETTGFLYNGGKIVEVGIVELNLDTFSKVVLYDKVVQEAGMTQKSIEDAWIFKNSDLTVEEVLAAPLLDGEIEEIQDIVDAYPNGITAFNRDFDIKFLSDRGVVFPKLLPCPILLSTPICKLPNQYRSGGYKWPKVEEAYRHFFPDAKYVEKHRGADDAIHEAGIVLVLFRLGLFKV